MEAFLVDVLAVAAEACFVLAGFFGGIMASSGSNPVVGELFRMLTELQQPARRGHMQALADGAQKVVDSRRSRARNLCVLLFVIAFALKVTHVILDRLIALPPEGATR